MQIETMSECKRSSKPFKGSDESTSYPIISDETKLRLENKLELYAACGMCFYHCREFLLAFCYRFALKYPSFLCLNK